MTPQEFTAKWSDVRLNEAQSYQPHFIDLCHLVGHSTPDASGLDENGKAFLFEKYARDAAGGGGYADVYYQDHFAIEYKAADKYPNLNAAYQQLLRYREGLNNPPLLVVTDINNWEIHTNFPNTSKTVYRFTHAEIADHLPLLRHMFNAPERLHPQRNAEQVTQDAAKAFQLIADNMRHWNTDPQRIATFLTKLVFCLFAEDIGLLPTAFQSHDGIFTYIIQQSRKKPGAFKQYVQNLFVAMNEGGDIFMEDIRYFNGTLFQVVSVEELSAEAIDALADAAKLDWANIEPSIFGTLFERSLDPAKRSQLGAHYTSRDDILLIVEPVLMQPLRYAWDTTKLKAEPLRGRLDQASTGRAKTTATNQLLDLRRDILERVRSVKVLDPACGSGNFLYVSLQMLMDLEKEIIDHPLWQGLQLPAPQVHPRQMYGIEINPIAHALASIVVWIGFIQWRQNNGYHNLFSEPILEKLGDNIVCKDAILPPAETIDPRPHARAPKMRVGEKTGPRPPAPSPIKGVGEKSAGLSRRGMRDAEGTRARWDVSPGMRQRMTQVARDLRKRSTAAEDKLWQAIRRKQVDGFKFRRQMPIGAFVVDFYCASARLAVEVDGPIHDTQLQADRIRQDLIESLGIRMLRLSNDEVENSLDSALAKIRAALALAADPHPPAPSPIKREGESGASLAGDMNREGDKIARQPRRIYGEAHLTLAARSPQISDPDQDADSAVDSPSPLVGEGAGGRGVEWPAVDVIVGNPPFLGGSKLRGELGDDYYERLTAHYAGRLPGFADLVCYWFENAREQIENGNAKRAGLLATNSIRGGANREVLKRIKETGDIFMAWSDREWILDGAAVRVSMVGFDKAVRDEKTLDGLPVHHVNPDLTATADITVARKLVENRNLCFEGSKKAGNFDIKKKVADDMLRDDERNALVVRPWVNGSDIVRHPRDRWIIDFSSMSYHEAGSFELPMKYIVENVKPKRINNAEKSSRENWWLHQRARPEMRHAMESAAIARFICTPRVAKHRIFVWLDLRVLPDSATNAIARDDDYFFGVLHSKLHEVWSLRMGTSLEDRPRYTPTTTFETFPFPWSPGHEDTSHPAHAAISAAAKQLHAERHAWLHPPDASAKALKDRTLTNLYNALQVFRGQSDIKRKPAAADFAPRLDELHRTLDEAVCDAYGWEAGVLEDEEEILRRLLALNLGRAESEDV